MKDSPKSTNPKSITITLHTAQDDNRAVYLAGNLNKWKPGDKKFKMKKTGDGSYTFSFHPTKKTPELIEFKFIKENWHGEELDDNGLRPEVRRLDKKPYHLTAFVPKWKNQPMNYNPDFLPVIQTISEEFEIPQLIKTRRITALLPHDYHSSDKRYPVLYLQDGQNLFDDYAPFGSWEVDKRLAQLAESGQGDIIIIAIDHAEEERIAEFTPTTVTKLGIGDGKRYARFLAETLKPYVDAHFRTKPEPEFTGIGGSSMGGLISIYAVFQYPELYSRLMIFSPSLWVHPQLPEIFAHEASRYDGKIYLYGGGNEGEELVKHLQHFYTILSATENYDVKLTIKDDGQHNEHAWGEAFPNALRWLFFD